MQYLRHNLKIEKRPGNLVGMRSVRSGRYILFMQV
jgi:hypothetical protein